MEPDLMSKHLNFTSDRDVVEAFKYPFLSNSIRAETTEKHCN